MRGAGGTPGGTFLFPLGVIMMCGGFYLLLNSIVIRASWGLGHSLYSFGGFNVTSGMIMIPFLFGVGFVFYDSRSKICLLYTSPSPRDRTRSRMPSSA